MTPKTCIIVQARMTSTRLPGKVLMPIMGRPMLAYELERLGRVQQADQIVVATTVRPEDDAVAAFCEADGVACFRGSEHDVLERYAEAAAWCGAGTVVRVTADCPVIDPPVVDKVIAAFRAQPDDNRYVSNTVERTYPRGLDCEVFSALALTLAHREASQPTEREHVTPFFYRNPNRFDVLKITNDIDLSSHRWTVDTVEDFELIEKILCSLYPSNPTFGMFDILRLLDANPSWQLINAEIEQKTH